MKKLLIGILFLCTQLLLAQRSLTIEEATIGAYREFATESINFIQWQNDESFTHIDQQYRNLMVRKQANDYQPSVLLSLTDLQLALLAKKADFPTAQLYYFPYQYEWINEHLVRFPIQTQEKNYEAFYDFKQNEIQSIISYPLTGTEPLLSNNQQYLAYLDEGVIKLKDTTDTETIVTKKEKNIVYGSKSTHREEFGIKEGMWFSPQNDQLLYYRKDESMVSDYPLVDFSARVAENKPIKYPMAGMKSEEVTLWVYDIKSQKHVQLQTGEPKEQFLTMVTWHPNGQSVYVGVLNRAQNHLKINQYSAKTGAFEKTLLEETSDKYVEPQFPLYFTPENHIHFIYLTEGEGYRQPVLYSTKGKLIRKLGYQDVVVKDIIGITNTYLWYIGTDNSALNNALYAVNINSGKTQKISQNQGTHEFVLNPSKTYFVDQYSNIKQANEVEVVQVRNHQSIKLLSSKNPYEGIIDLPEMELLEITAADDETILNGRIIYPKDFDADKKYPVFMYVYGGPHAQLVTDSWLGGASLFDYYMAQQGFVVFTLDNRGSANRGRDFEQVIHRQLGQVEMKDQMKGIDFLRSLPFVDTDKIGVYGWSYGGFMTTSLLLNQPETFKVGVAGGPVIDWKWYEIMYGERYMDTPDENPEGYALTSTLDKVKNLQGRLLIIHGAQDPVVVQQHSMEFIEACIKAGKQVDYFLYPSHEHNVMGMDRVHLHAKIADYFITHLK